MRSKKQINEHRSTPLVDEKLKGKKNKNIKENQETKREQKKKTGKIFVT